MQGHANALAHDVRGLFKETGLTFALASRNVSPGFRCLVDTVL